MIGEQLAELLPVQEGDAQSAFRQEVLRDYWICIVSREASLLARKEVLTGKAKFGIIGDGKEVPQVALAKAMEKGDFRSGYYRDQTLMFALGLSTVEQFFAQLYADPANDPFSGGRQMNCHFANPFLDDKGDWLRLTDQYNISSDISSTGGQMARALGLALASKKFRQMPGMDPDQRFSREGREVVFCTIGDASTSEGVFWETMNAAAVQKVPLAVNVWDDGYGISVPIEYQTVKKSISRALAGFELDESGEGIYLFSAKAWDYPGLVEMYKKGVRKVRDNHRPALFHIQEVTQPQGHSTSGSHERYKSKERLQWEQDYDCIRMLRTWMLENGIARAEDLDRLEEESRRYVRQCKENAWKAYQEPVNQDRDALMSLFAGIPGLEETPGRVAIREELKKTLNPFRSDLVKAARQMLLTRRGQAGEAWDALRNWLDIELNKAERHYASHLMSETPRSALRVPVVPAVYGEASLEVTGFQILNTFFDHVLTREPRFLAFGEDLGRIGDVNQGFAGMQEKYGEERVFDTGIREWTIMGQAIGMAMRGLRPLAEIQYLDYLIFGLQPLTDDLATVRWRSVGMQMAPAIIRTRGHRLEGIWHAGSPIGMLIHSLRGMCLGVPRNMVQAAGMYNTLLQSDDPGLIIECLNGYRLKERMPENLGSFTVPFGRPEVLRTGSDLTLLTYGSCVRVAQEACLLLESQGIAVELLDAQTLLPFDLEEICLQSVRKTNRLLVVDEDVPGGGSAYLLQEVVERQGAYRYLDSAPRTLSAKAHRTPYGSDGDYFTKPNVEDICEMVREILHESDPSWYPI